MLLLRFLIAETEAVIHEGYETCFKDFLLDLAHLEPKNPQKTTEL